MKKLAMLPKAEVKDHVVAGQRYRGANPEYAPVRGGWMKVKKGVPWVRV